jgi:hypothetical protein
VAASGIAPFAITTSGVQSQRLVPRLGTVWPRNAVNDISERAHSGKLTVATTLPVALGIQDAQEELASRLCGSAADPTRATIRGRFSTTTRPVAGIKLRTILEQPTHANRGLADIPATVPDAFDRILFQRIGARRGPGGLPASPVAQLAARSARLIIQTSTGYPVPGLESLRTSPVPSPETFANAQRPLRLRRPTSEFCFTPRMNPGLSQSSWSRHGDACVVAPLEFSPFIRVRAASLLVMPRAAVPSPKNLPHRRDRHGTAQFTGLCENAVRNLGSLPDRCPPAAPARGRNEIGVAPNCAGLRVHTHFGTILPPDPQESLPFTN